MIPRFELLILWSSSQQFLSEELVKVTIPGVIKRTCVQHLNQQWQVHLTNGENIETEQHLATTKSPLSKIITTQMARMVGFFTALHRTCCSGAPRSRCWSVHCQFTNMCLRTFAAGVCGLLGHQLLWFRARVFAAAQWPLVPFSPLDVWDAFRASVDAPASSSELLSMSLRTSLDTCRGDGNQF